MICINIINNNNLLCMLFIGKSFKKKISILILLPEIPIKILFVSAIQNLKTL